MRNKILEKLDAEYECFFNDMLRTSKENLFANSDEISLKKEIQRDLRELVKTSKKFENEDLSNKILISNNVMEICYRYAIDHPDIDTRTACEKVIFSI